MNIYGKKVILRAIEQEDGELIRGMFNDPDMERLVIGWAFPVSAYAQNKWLEKHYGDNSFRWIIETKEDGAVGIATFVNIDWKNGCANHGMKLAKGKNRSRGIGTDTVMAIERYAFDELRLHRLDGGWFPDNLPSKNMYMKCGWRVEGIKRDAAFKGGKWHDMEYAGITAEDYYRVVEETNYWQE